MTYVFLLLLAALVGYDAYNRRNKWIGWAAGTFVLSPVVIPAYLTLRNLKEGEKRTGGRGWNGAKYFALVWTGLMAAWAFSGLVIVAEHASPNMSEAEQAGLGLGAALSMGMIGFFWFGGVAVSLMLGFFLKDDTAVEEGPTGELADQEPRKVEEGIVAGYQNARQNAERARQVYKK